jgi:outer membrane lipoprotein-sorting protein
MRLILTIIIVALSLGGCASKSSEISAAYVSPIPYQSYTCQQLGMEAQAVSAKAAELSGVQDQKRTNDAIATGVAIVVFWPAAFLVGGDGQVAAQLSQLKGQMNAIEQASIHKNCGIQFRQAPATS